MAMVSGTARTRAPWRTRVHAVGATGTAALLLGTTVLAPFSMTAAFAAPGDATATNTRGTHSVTAATATGGATLAVLDIAAAEEPAATTPAKQPAAGTASTALYTLEQFMFSGAVNWGGYRFTYYSEQVLPGPGLEIPGRHVNDDGYVSDSDGYIVLAGDAPKGTVFETPFGHPGKIYDRGTFGTHLDVYIR